MGVGHRIRTARESRGLSLQRVSDETKIPVRLVAALEAEDYRQLPRGIFARGYVRAVAGAVGLDPETLADAFRDETTPSDAAAPAVAAFAPAVTSAPGGAEQPRLRLAIDTSDLQSTRRSLSWVAVLVVLTVVAAIAWFGRAADGRGPDEAAPPSTSAPVAHRDSPHTPRPVATSGKGSGASDGTGPVQVVLAAERPCWIAFTVDGERVAYRLLQPGERVTATMRSEAMLRTGDAGALTIGVGGQPARPLGGPGEVRTVTFTPANHATVLAAR